MGPVLSWRLADEDIWKRRQAPMDLLREPIFAHAELLQRRADGPSQHLKEGAGAPVRDEVVRDTESR